MTNAAIIATPATVALAQNPPNNHLLNDIPPIAIVLFMLFVCAMTIYFMRDLIRR